MRRIARFLVAFLLVFGGIPFRWTNVSAADDNGVTLNAPESSKTLKDNGDGTSTLSLSVKGSAKTSETTTSTGADVIMVVDSSSSMRNHSSSKTGAWGYREWNSGGSTTFYPLAIRNGNTYTRLKDGDETGNAQLYINSRADGNGTWSEYSSSRSRFTNTTRLDDTKAQVKSLAQSLSTAEGVSIALISFNSSATVKYNLTGLNSSTLDGFNTAVNGLTYNMGTNWTAALQSAYNMADGVKDNGKPTYVIFLTDGEPYGGDGGTYWNSITKMANTSLYAIFAFGDSGAATLKGKADAAGATYYDASDLDKLKEVFDNITQTITNHLAYGNVTVTDTVTADVTSASVDLVNGAAGSFSYTVKDASGATVKTWKDGETSFDGINEATVENGKVVWNLGEDYVLRDGYTYTVSFVVWPDQTAMDYVAGLNNGIYTWNDATATLVPGKDYYKGGVSKYPSIVKYTDGTFGILTNSDQTVSYQIATTTNGVTTYGELQTAKMAMPDPLRIREDKLTLEKIWEDTLDPSQRAEVEEVVLDLLRDEEVYLSNIRISDESDWKLGDYLTIAPGRMVSEGEPAYSTDYQIVSYNGTKYAILETGHEYKFTEDDINTHFELTRYTYHPMLIDGVLKDVVFSRDATGKITGIAAVTDMTQISVTNTMKGGINIEKKVTGKADYSKDKFTITTELKNPDGTAYEYDYRVYYGVNNPEYGKTRTCEGEIEDKNRSCHKYGEGTLTEEIYVGDVIRIVNVKAGTLYAVSEGDLAVGYSLSGIQNTIQYGANGEVKADTVAETENGKNYYAVKGNSASTATVTNQYNAGELEISKTVEVNAGADETTAKAKEFEFTVNLYEADGTTKLTDSYAYAGAKQGEIKSGEKIKLADGEKITIAELPEGAKYEISEASVSGYTASAEGATGTIAKNKTTSAKFTNTYTVEPASVTLMATKNFNAWLDTDQFGFELRDAEGELVESKAATLAMQNVSFSPITLGAEGTYTYTISEPNASIRAGVVRSFGDSDITATVTVKDNGEGKLVATVEYANGKQTIVNEYIAEGDYGTEGELEFTKTLEGREWLDTDVFNFIISADDAKAPLPRKTKQSATKANGAKFDFGTIHFTQKDVGKTYAYTVAEDTPTMGGVTKVSGDVQFTLSVVDNGDGTLSFIVSDYAQEFVNRYTAAPTTATITARKEFGNWWEDDDIFTLELKNAEGEVVQTKEATFTQKDVAFRLNFSEAGVYTYTVSEIEAYSREGIRRRAGDADIAATVTVVDNLDGTLTATVSYADEKQVIVNEYSAPKAAKAAERGEVKIPDTGQAVSESSSVVATTGLSAVVAIALVYRARKRGVALRK